MEDNRLWEELHQLRKKKKDELQSLHKLLEDKSKNKREKKYRDPEPPKLVLSIIGDSKSFVPKPWITSVFQYGLIETAKGAKDSLIIYKGSSETVSCIVREAVEDFNRLQSEGDDVFISLVGILPEEDMCETSIDLDEEQIHLHDKKKHTGEEHYGWDYWQKKNSDCLLGEIYNVWLGNNRSYAEFHASMLKGLVKNKISFMTLEGTPLQWNVPVLTIVAEGDLDTIEAVDQVLKQDLPILIVKGSGKAADFIAEFIENDKISISEYIKYKTPLLFGISSHDLMKREFVSKGSGSQKHQRNDLESIMKAIKENKCLLTIIDINKQTQPKEFTDAVTRAIISGWSRNKPEDDDQIYGNLENDQIKPVQSYYHACINDDQFPLPVEPNMKEKVNPTSVSINAMGGTLRADNRKFKDSIKEILTPSSLPLYYYIAYQLIQEIQGEKRATIENFNMLLKAAIVADRDEYVSVLLEEEGVEFEDKYFPHIYTETIQSQQKAKTALRNVFKWGSSPVIKQFKDLCFPEEKEKKKKEKKKKDKQVNQILPIEVCMIAGRQICQALLGYPRDTSLNRKEKWSAYQDLLIWAIFVNRPKLATIFWMKCEQPLLCALLASSVYKRMAASAYDQATKSDMTAQSRLFADRALDLQSRLYDDDAELAMDLVITEKIVWDITISPMQCAYEHDMLDVLAQTCPQRRLNKIWYSGISSSLGGFWKKGCLKAWCCCCKKGSPCEGPKLFVAPLTRFLLHYVFFFGALVCYSNFLLQMDVFQGVVSIGFNEKVVYLYLVGDILEEYRNAVWKDASFVTKMSKSTHENTLRHSRWYRLKKYLFNFWNILDVLSYTLTIVAIFVRVFRSTKTNKTYRRFFSMSLFAMYMRFLHVLLMSRKLGPKIIMIKEMLKDLFRFIGILFVFMIGVGVLYHANMYPAHTDMWSSVDWKYWRIWKIIYIPYWQIYGDSMLEKFDENSNTPCTTIQSEWENNPDMERCNEYDWILVVITALYMLMSNLLLVNLLIAVFSYRFERVQENSEKLWRYLRYEVIMDYKSRIPAPLNIIFRPLNMLYRCCRNDDERKQHKPDRRLVDRINTLQSVNAINCVYNI
ncbi:transient receptor potential cation channel subfamily M member 2-like isoform X2 [Mytilus californianus]|uniref:transient receptor potential cation channel subfamily M member 2-like isoform X2 n=1 Tax=Mytilus californianus TaxID=6549 RepID=UPI0022479896|nr:transient receptor potential cation channel subfamily M member 2-like isoform X2 [Mytilus californianus]